MFVLLDGTKYLHAGYSAVKKMELTFIKATLPKYKIAFLHKL